MSKFVELHLKGGDYKLAICDPNSNWDTYINSKGLALSIAKKPSCKSTFFGDINHIKRLISKGYFNGDLDHFTNYGLMCFCGLHSQLCKDSKGNQFAILKG